MLPQLPASQAAVRPCETVGEWWSRHRAIACGYPQPIQQAIVGGFIADRVGWAFASGYQAALHSLVPDLPAERLCAFCVTEEDGNAPKAIKSSLKRSGEGLLLEGAKRWTTLGHEVALFLVAARDADAIGERPSLKVARVAANLPGVSIEKMPAMSFVPEVPHARLRFHNVMLPDTSLLPGDGYDRYVKPFRTVEDIHVQAAVFAYLLREAQRLKWPENWIERLWALLAALSKLAEMPASHAQTHVALAGTLAIGAGLIEAAEKFWEASATDPAALRWRRDHELLNVAGCARKQRAKRAWESLRRLG